MHLDLSVETLLLVDLMRLEAIQLENKSVCLERHLVRSHE